jgi:hypothetical protein
MRLRSIVICSLPDCTMFPHYLINGMILGEKKNWIRYVFRVSLYFVFNISHYKRNCDWYGQKCILVFMWSAPHIGLHVKCPSYWSSCEVPLIFRRILNATWISSTDFRKMIKHQISRISVRTDKWTDMAKLTVAFRNFANAYKNVSTWP